MVYLLVLTLCFNHDDIANLRIYSKTPVLSANLKFLNKALTLYFRRLIVFDNIIRDHSN